MVDAHANFAVSAVATAPSPAASGTELVVTTGHGTRFPAVPFNAVVWPTGVAPTPLNSEVVRVTGIATDTFTITRTQEGSSAHTVIVGDQIAAAITAKSFTDIETVPYAARAYRTATQVISDSVQTKVELNNEEYDIGGNFDAVTNFRFTAPVAGFYQVNCAAALYKSGGTTGTFDAILLLRVDGAEVRRLQRLQLPSVVSGEVIGLAGAALFKLTAGQYIEMYVYCNPNDGTPTIEAPASDGRSPFMEVVFLGS